MQTLNSSVSCYDAWSSNSSPSTTSSNQSNVLLSPRREEYTPTNSQPEVNGPRPREQVVSQKARRKGIWNLKTSETHKPTEAYQMGKSDNWKVKQFLIYCRPRFPCSSSGVKEFSYHLRCYRKDLTLFNNWPNIRVVKLFNSRDTFLFEETRETSMPWFRKCVSKLLR